MKLRIILPIIGIIIAVVAAVVFISATGGGGKIENNQVTKSQIEKPTEELQIGAPVPDFTLSNFAGETVSLSQFAGQPVVVNFWAAWCPFCTDEMPDFDKVYRQVGQPAGGDVVFLGIHRTATESLEIGKEFGEPLVSYPLLADTTDEVYKTLTGGQPAMPFTMIVDRDGKVAFRKFGPITEEELTGQVQKVI